MYLILTSITIRLLAAALAFRMAVRFKTKSLYCLPAALVILAGQQLFRLGTRVRLDAALWQQLQTESLGLAVSVLCLVAVYAIDERLKALRRRGSRISRSRSTESADTNDEGLDGLEPETFVHRAPNHPLNRPEADNPSSSELRLRLQREISAHSSFSGTSGRTTQQFGELAESVGLAILAVKDKSGEMTYANSCFRKIFGVSDLEQLGICPTEWTERIHADDRQMVEEELSRSTVESRESIRFRIGIQNETRWIRAGFAHMEDEEGAQRLFIAEDITGQVQLKERLRRKDRVETLGRLAGGIAHDFNNLLSPILCYAEMAMMDAERGQHDEIPQFMREVMTASLRARELVERILEFSKQRDPIPLPINPHKLTLEIAALMNPLLPAGVELKVRSEDGAQDILGDAGLLHQVLVNLCKNAKDAIQAGKPGTILLWVRRGRSRPDDSASRIFKDKTEIIVRDNGMGIPPDEIDKIFDDFFTTKSSSGGSGIGLAIVQGIIERLGGTIDVRSRLGRGTEFRITMPISDSSPSKVAQGTEPSREKKTGGSILLVDDDEAVLASTEKLLRRLGYAISTARSAEEALAACLRRRDEFDMVLTDHAMGGRSGTELCQVLHDRWPDLRLMLMTGHHGDTSMPELRLAGVIDVIYKPIQVSELQEAINRVLQTRLNSVVPETELPNPLPVRGE